MASEPPREPTDSPDATGGGGQQQAAALFPLIYDELRAIAEGYMGRQSSGHTLQPTALVHEAYARLARPADACRIDRDHFMAVAAVAMRQVLVNHAKSKHRIKRGGGRAALTIEHVEPQAADRPVDLVALDEALTRLAEIDARQAQIVELRFFAGLTVEETARALDVSERTVHRDWTMARLWLRGEIEQNADDGS